MASRDLSYLRGETLSCLAQSRVRLMKTSPHSLHASDQDADSLAPRDPGGLHIFMQSKLLGKQWFPKKETDNEDRMGKGCPLPHFGSVLSGS